jgi:DNA-binding XRE family transcriptional regulator
MMATGCGDFEAGKGRKLDAVGILLALAVRSDVSRGEDGAVTSVLKKKEVLQRLGARARELRRARELTQPDLAGVTGFSVAYLSLIERGQRNPPYLTLLHLARALHVRMADFCMDE